MTEVLKENNNTESDKYVSLKEMLEHQEIKDNLTVPLGKENNNYHYIGFRDIPCLLITGETGSGKSVFIDSLIISLMIKNNPKDIKFIMMDPKKIELGYYNGLDYTAGDMISNGKESNIVLNYIKKIYDRRKELLKEKTLDEYNEVENNPKLFHLFVIVDESNDMITIDGSLDILKQMIKDCDKVGIHIIIATNSPYDRYFDKEFINQIKYKISFDLTSKAEASWIGIRGSQKLSLGEFIVKSIPQNIRLKLQTPYISDEEIMKEIEYLRNLSNR